MAKDEINAAENITENAIENTFKLLESGDLNLKHYAYKQFARNLETTIAVNIDKTIPIASVIANP